MPGLFEESEERLNLRHKYKFLYSGVPGERRDFVREHEDRLWALYNRSIFEREDSGRVVFWHEHNFDRVNCKTEYIEGEDRYTTRFYPMPPMPGSGKTLTVYYEELDGEINVLGGYMREDNLPGSERDSQVGTAL